MHMGYRTTKSKIKVENSKTNNYTEFYYHFFRNTLIVSLPLLIISAFILSIPHSSANNSGSDNLAITISSSCTLSSVVNIPHNAEVYNGHYLGDIGKTTIKTLCNDGNGYSVYAVGYSNNEEGNNKLINSEYPQYSIDAGLATSGLTSQWAMKLNNIPDDPSPTPPTIEAEYNNTYGIVPPYWTKVAIRTSGTTDMAQGSSFTTTYAVYASSSQYAGTYQGQVKYLLTHPNSNASTMNDIDAAFWLAGKQKVYSNENGSYFAMQDMTNDICNSVSQNGERTATQLVDTRDNKLYWVTKLKDGHCWMTQNLDLDLVAYTNSQGQEVMKPLTSSDTDLTDHSLVGAYSQTNGYSYDENTGITTWIPATSATTIDFTGTTIAGWQNSLNNPYSASKVSDTVSSHESIGNYYNWPAAIASNNSKPLNTNTINNINDNPQNSICPKGWRLPTISDQTADTSGSTNEFARLNYLYNDGSSNNSTGLISAPTFFVKASYITPGGSLYNTNSEGRYWSSSNYNSDGAWHLLLRDTFVSTREYYIQGYSRNYGLSIRCLAR